MKTTISRRDFLKGTLAGAVSVAAVGVLGACSSSPSDATLEESTKSETTSAESSVASEISQQEASTASVPTWTELNPQDESYDSYTTDYSILFTPIQVGHMTLRNRIVKAAAGSDTLARSDVQMSQNALDYYGRMADGGAALVVVEDSVVNGFGASPFGNLRTETVEDGITEMAKLADRIHAGGAYACYQIGIGSPLDPGDVNAYTLEDLQNIIKGYGECTLNAKKAGFDSVELKGATTDGLNQFVSRHINNREDEYGAQTEENRVRFFCELVASVREACGDDFSILTLINAVEENDKNLGDNDGYIILEEAQNLAKALEKAGADLIQVRVGASMEANDWATDTCFAPYKAAGSTGFGTQFDYKSHFGGLMDGAHSGAGAFIPLAKEIKKVVTVPVGCASYMDPRTTPDLINNALKNEDIDLVFMNRPLTVDPELPNKLQAGKRDEIAPCTRCFHCHGKPYGEPEKCRVNATTQYAYTEEFPEGYDLTPVETSKNVMVIGGGVAGMEAARIAAERGHNVTLYEKNGYMGGMLLYADAIKGSHERLIDLRDYLVRQQELKGVQVITGTEVTTDLVKEENPDVVIVAVGGARETHFQGTNVIDMDHFMGSEIGENVVILGANLQAVDIAMYLLAQGKHITLVHEKTADDVDSEQSYWVRKYNKAHMYAHGVKVWNEATVDNVNSDSVTISLKTGITKTISCDTVIECYDMIPNTTLLDEIKAAGYEAYGVGCDAPSNIQSSIHAGYKVSRYLN
jgi:2,4-dienoyl-CoA reductase-like NADH-dependent reductase (Old Yellow Enzyme family)/thioredoxin reductase